eukprot:1646551-Prymnesium_polylepis.1
MIVRSRGGTPDTEAPGGATTNRPVVDGIELSARWARIRELSSSAGAVARRALSSYRAAR